MRIPLLTTLVLAIGLMSAAAQSPQPQNRQTRTTAQQELVEAQTANDRAQALYYEELTKRLLAPTPTPTPPPLKSFRQNLAENPVPIVGVLGALVAASFTALVALFTLYVNNRAVLRSHADTQFYEALKMFGDKNSSVRSSAAGILSRMAIEPRRFDLRHPITSIRGRRQPYFGVAHNDLFSGLLVERDRFTLLQIRRALYQIVHANPTGMATALINANTRLQTELLNALVRFFKAHGVTNSAAISEDVWNKVPKNIYSIDVYKFLTNYDENFASTFAAPSFDMGERPRKKNLAERFQDLNLVSFRLYLVVDIYCAAIKKNGKVGKHPRNRPLFLVKGDLRGVDFRDADLTGVFLAGAKLGNAKLNRANLAASWLDDADLTNAAIGEATIDSTTSIRNANWWTADFFTNPTRKQIDSRLIEFLYNQDRTHLPTDAAKVHASVKPFVVKLNEENVGPRPAPTAFDQVRDAGAEDSLRNQ